MFVLSFTVIFGVCCPFVSAAWTELHELCRDGVNITVDDIIPLVEEHPSWPKLDSDYGPPITLIWRNRNVCRSDRLEIVDYLRDHGGVAYDSTWEAIERVRPERIQAEKARKKAEERARKSRSGDVKEAYDALCSYNFCKAARLVRGHGVKLLDRPDQKGDDSCIGLGEFNPSKKMEKAAMRAFFDIASSFGSGGGLSEKRVFELVDLMNIKEGTFQPFLSQYVFDKSAFRSWYQSGINGVKFWHRIFLRVSDRTLSSDDVYKVLFSAFRGRVYCKGFYDSFSYGVPRPMFSSIGPETLALRSQDARLEWLKRLDGDYKPDAACPPPVLQLFACTSSAVTLTLFRVECCLKLLEEGARANDCTCFTAEGDSLLHFLARLPFSFYDGDYIFFDDSSISAKSKIRKIVKIIMERGVDIHHKNNKGEDAYQLAKENGREWMFPHSVRSEEGDSECIIM